MFSVFIHGLALLFVMVSYKKYYTDLARSMATRRYSRKQMAMITALFQRRAAHEWYFTRSIFVWSIVTAIAADVLWMSKIVWLIWALCIVCWIMPQSRNLLPNATMLNSREQMTMMSFIHVTIERITVYVIGATFCAIVGLFVLFFFSCVEWMNE